MKDQYTKGRHIGRGGGDGKFLISTQIEYGWNILYYSQVLWNKEKRIKVWIKIRTKKLLRRSNLMNCYSKLGICWLRLSLIDLDGDNESWGEK